jgi:hypothetical protein
MVSKPRDGGPDGDGTKHEPARTGNEFEAADYIGSVADNLPLIARRHGMDTLVYLLDMVKMEADEEKRLWRSRYRVRDPSEQ